MKSGWLWATELYLCDFTSLSSPLLLASECLLQLKLIKSLHSRISLHWLPLSRLSFSPLISTHPHCPLSSGCLDPCPSPHFIFISEVHRPSEGIMFPHQLTWHPLTWKLVPRPEEVVFSLVIFVSGRDDLLHQCHQRRRNNLTHHSKQQITWLLLLAGCYSLS